MLLPKDTGRDIAHKARAVADRLAVRQAVDLMRALAARNDYCVSRVVLEVRPDGRYELRLLDDSGFLTVAIACDRWVQEGAIRDEKNDLARQDCDDTGRIDQ